MSKVRYNVAILFFLFCFILIGQAKAYDFDTYINDLHSQTQANINSQARVNKIIDDVLSHDRYEYKSSGYSIEDEKNRLRDKIVTFCSPGVYNTERCAKYCKELGEWDVTHKLCKSPGRAKSPKASMLKIQKEIIKNDNGTITEIVKENIKATIAKVETTFDVEHKKIYKEVKTKIKNDDETITQKNIRTNFNKDAKFKEEITEKVFDKNILVKSVVLQKNKDNIVETQKFFDDTIITELIVQEGSTENNLQDIEYKFYNSALIDNADLQAHQILVKYDSEKKKNIQNIFFDVMEQKLVITKIDNKHEIIELTDQSNILYSDNLKMNFNVPLTVDLNMGSIFVVEGTGSLIEWKVLPSKLKTQILQNGELDKINIMQIVNDDVKYVVSGVKNKKILGVYSIEIEQYRTYNIETGELLQVEMNNKNKILNHLSF